MFQDGGSAIHELHSRRIRRVLPDGADRREKLELVKQDRVPIDHIIQRLLQHLSCQPIRRIVITRRRRGKRKRPREDGQKEQGKNTAHRNYGRFPHARGFVQLEPKERWFSTIKPGQAQVPKGE